jgi:hypothetical protein
MTNKQWMLMGAVLVVGLAAYGVYTATNTPSRKVAKSAPQNDCALNATVQYNKDSLALSQREADAEVALLQQGAVSDSVEITIARRRLEEQYCLRFARCLYPNPTVQPQAVELSTTFDTCLRDEALEKYDAVLR